MAKKEANSKENNKNKKKFWKSFKAELKKVTWPTPKQLANNTIVVIAMVLITGIIVLALNLVFESINEHGVDKIKELITTNDTATENEESNSEEENTEGEDTNTENEGENSNEETTDQNEENQDLTNKVNNEGEESNTTVEEVTTTENESSEEQEAPVEQNTENETSNE